MENSFKTLVDNAKSIAILLPVGPYFDQVAAALSLYLAVKDKNEVVVSCPSAMTVEFNRLVGVDKISQEIGNKSLIITLPDYDANKIDKVFWDAEGEFKLTIQPKLRELPPSKDQVVISYLGVDPDLVVFVGGVAENHFPWMSEVSILNAKKAHIGVQDLNIANVRDIASFARPAAACSEIIYTLIREMGLNVSADMATNLLTGLQEGSKNFTTNVTSDTFKTASELMSFGGKLSVRDNRVSPVGASGNSGQGAPQSWLTTPKIYRGAATS